MRADRRSGVQDEQHPWRNERAQIVQFGAPAGMALFLRYTGGGWLLVLTGYPG
jgi:hypothetical protein